MQTNQPRERKRKPFLWIFVVVAVLLIGAMGIYSRYMWTHPPQVRTPVVVRGKIPAPPPTEGDSSGNAPGERSQNDQETAQDAAMDAGPHESAAGMETENAAAPQQEVAADSRPESEDDAEQAGGAAASSDDQASATGAGDARPATPAVGELQAAIQEPPAENAPSPDTATPASPDLPTAHAEPIPTPEAPNVTETIAPYAIQVGAYRAKSNADRQISQLQGKGFDAYLYEKNDKDQRAWYFVRFGRFESFKAAQQALTAFKAQEQAEGAIVRSKSD